MRTLAELVMLAALVTGCSRSEPVVDETAARADDKRALGTIVAIDVRASQAMREADDAALKGDAGAATSVVRTRALPAVEEALRAAEGASMRSAWGRAKKEELTGVLRDRKASMPAYEEAATSGDPEKMLTAVEMQASLERRALAVVAAVEEGR